MNNATILAENHYDAPPPFRVRWATPLTAVAVFLTTVVLTVASFPPYNVSEMAYVFATPAALWAYRRPSFRLFAAVVLGALFAAASSSRWSAVRFLDAGCAALLLAVACSRLSFLETR